MIHERKLYSLDDISIIPEVLSDIESRKECSPWTTGIEGQSEFYPIIAAPMDSVVDDSCWQNFHDNRISCVIPRTVSLEKRLELCKEVFCAFSLSEAETYFSENYDGIRYVLIDIANGHMRKQVELGRKLKKLHGDNLKLMGGNIANPETYLEYDKAGFDYLRVGIGGGCFIKGTKILMSNNEEKLIEEVMPGDKIINSKGEIDTVVNTLEFESDKNLLKINDSIVCTENHKFYVVNKSDVEKITDYNIHDYAYWIESNELDKEKHMLIELNV